jgi:hypothetical protein
MSGWQGIGVVLSVLWCLFIPAHFFISHNQIANDYYVTCLNSAYRNLTSDELQRAIQSCSVNLDAMFMNPAKMFKTLLLEDYYDGLALWAFILVPIAGLWIVGGIVFAAIRWISRGFKSRNA